MTWDSLVTQLFQPSDTVLFGFFDVVTAMVVSTFLCLMLAHIYRITHRGTSYSQSFLVTMMLMGVTTAVVMMIIGSNIARAFSLVGALSIIRFRTAMKDPRDTGFLFASMVAGMGCGTMFYMPAIALTIFVSVLALLLYHFDFGVKQRLESVIHVTFAQSPGAEEKIEAELKDRFPRVKLINRIMDFGDGRVTNVYVVRPSSLSSFEDAEDQLKNLNGVVRLARYETDQHVAL